MGPRTKSSELFSDLKTILSPGALKRVIRQVLENDYMALAGQLAYFFALFLFPFQMLLVSLVGIVVNNPEPALNALAERTQGVVPQEVVGVLSSYAERSLRSQSPVTLLFATLITFMVGAAAAEAIAKAANRSYGVRETRPFWKVRGISFLLIAGYTLLFAALVFMVFNPQAGSQLRGLLGLPAIVPEFWRILSWALAFLIVTFAIDVLYYVAPNADLPFKWITPGGVLATILLLVGSEITRLWATNIFRAYQLYGQLGAGIVLLIWLFIVGLMVLIGLEVNAVLAQMEKERRGGDPAQGEDPADDDTNP